MRPAQRGELILGLLTLVIGLLALGWLFLSPGVSYIQQTNGRVESGTTSYIQAAGLNATLGPLVILALPHLGIAIGASLDVQRNSLFWKIVLLVSTLLLVLLALLSAASYFLLPSLVCALITTGLSWQSRQQQPVI